MTRTGLSIPPNIAEGYERDSPAEIARFLTIAKGSAGELVTQVYIGREAGYMSAESANAWVAETKELAKMLGALIVYWRKRRNETRGVRDEDE